MVGSTLRASSLNSDLKPTQDEVLRRVGRNLLAFQQIERLFKFLLSNHKAGGTPADFKERQQKQADTINNTTLGNLVTLYKTEVLQDAGVAVPEDEGPADWVTFSFRISADAKFIEAMRQDLDLMKDQRNELVHGFLPRWQPSSQEKLEETLAYLDAQHDKMRPMHEHLLTTANHIQDGRKMLVEFMASEEYQKQSELMLLQASPLVSLLRDAANQIRREDGWTYLARAGDLANRNLAEDVKNLKERYGFKTLKKLIVGSGLFDVFDEPLPDGQFRTLYKNKE